MRLSVLIVFKMCHVYFLNKMFVITSDNINKEYDFPDGGIKR